jgi:hypothetical protein
MFDPNEELHEGSAMNVLKRYPFDDRSASEDDSPLLGSAQILARGPLLDSSNMASPTGPVQECGPDPSPRRPLHDLIMMGVVSDQQPSKAASTFDELYCFDDFIDPILRE